MKPLFSLFIPLIVVSCVKKNTTTDPKWAHLDDFGGFGLAELLPNQSVSVCDAGEGAAGAVELVKASVLEWAAAIQRDKYIKVSTGCSGSTMNIRLLMSGSCGGAAAYTQPVGSGQFTITYCSPEYVAMKDINIHEVGHIWMQCDRYGDGDLSQAKFGANCSKTHTNNVETSSAMMAGGPHHPQKVTEDDRDAMIALAVRTDIPANAQWKTFLAQNPTQSPLPDTSFVPSSSPIPATSPSTGDGTGSIQSWCVQLRQKLNAGGQAESFEEQIGALLCP